jgi:hypothetical protein
MEKSRATVTKPMWKGVTVTNLTRRKQIGRPTFIPLSWRDNGEADGAWFHQKKKNCPRVPVPAPPPAPSPTTARAAAHPPHDLPRRFMSISPRERTAGYRYPRPPNPSPSPKHGSDRHRSPSASVSRPAGGGSGASSGEFFCSLT